MRLRGVRGLQVHITVNDEDRATEYVDPDTPDTNLRATRYIEAIAGAQFSIDITYEPKFKHRALDIKQQIWVDGKLKHDEFHRTANLKTGLARSIKRPNRSSARKVFRWKTLVISEDAATPRLNDEQRLALESTGLISVQLFRKEELEQFEMAQEEAAVPESKLKARAVYLSVDTGEAEPVTKSEWKVLDASDNPCAEFKFQYRSRQALRELRVIPIDHARERLRREAYREREERERVVRGIKRERELEEDSYDPDDYCVIDEEASTFRPLRRAWIDVATDGAPVVYVHDPNWFGNGSTNHSSNAGSRPPKLGKSALRKKRKIKASVHSPESSDSDGDGAGRPANPTMSGGRSGHPRANQGIAGRASVSPETEGGLHTGGDSYAENGFSGGENED